jgi:hypothetical protein
MERTDTPSKWDERSTLTTMLDYVRATVHVKCEGISEVDGFLPSLMVRFAGDSATSSAAPCLLDRPVGGARP